MMRILVTVIMLVGLAWPAAARKSCKEIVTGFKSECKNIYGKQWYAARNCVDWRIRRSIGNLITGEVARTSSGWAGWECHESPDCVDLKKGVEDECQYGITETEDDPEVRLPFNEQKSCMLRIMKDSLGFKLKVHYDIIDENAGSDGKPYAAILCSKRTGKSLSRCLKHCAAAKVGCEGQIGLRCNRKHMSDWIKSLCKQWKADPGSCSRRLPVCNTECRTQQ